MNIDIDHLYFWICAIRESPNPTRTMDAFWKGQLDSKVWLIDILKNYIDNPVKIDIHGGWVGLLSSMIFQSNIPVAFIRSIDIDPSCESIASTMNKKEEMDSRFFAITADMCDVRSDSDVVINTSCEHITQRQYEEWLSKINDHSLIILQSNNYEIAEHIRTAKDLEDFKSQSNLNKILYADEKELSLYKRFMIVGYK